MANKKPIRRILKEDSAPVDEESKSDKPTARRSRSTRPSSPASSTIRWVGRHIFPSYFVSSWRELKLVTWPKRKETRQLTTAVIFFAIVVGVVVSVLDLLLDKVFKKVILKQ